MRFVILTGSALILSVASVAAGDRLGHTTDLFDRCIGDCNDDRKVGVDELVFGVRLALGNDASDACLGLGYNPSISGLVTAVENSLLGCTSLHDFTGFTEFAYEQAPAFGFCPPVGSLHRAALHRRQDSYVLERSVIAVGTPGDADCLPEYLTGRPCLISRPLSCRTLTGDEIGRVNEVFAQITVWTAPAAFCLAGAADPCVVHNNSWDALATNDHVCAHALRLDSQQSLRLTQLVESLGAGPETSCPD